MGLDMYLDKETYVQNWDFQKPEEKHEITVKKGGEVVKSIDPAKIKFIVEEVGYWRKANAIHKWFVDNVQEGKDECQRSYVSRKQLQELLEVVNKILKDNSLAGTLLPTQSGFFFGSVTYDEWYFQVLEETKEILTNALNEGQEATFYYHSSW
jgi:hypothetical protein